MAIVAVVLIYRALPQPWRDIRDVGVVVGLLWGAVATLYGVWRYFSVSPDVDVEMCTSTALTALNPPSESTKNAK